MRRMRVIAMTVFTLVALMSLGMAVGAAAKGGHGLWHWFEIAGCFLFAAVMLTISAGLWVQWARQRWFQNRALSLPTGLVPRGKYASWANGQGHPARRMGGGSRIRTRKTLRRQR